MNDIMLCKKHNYERKYLKSMFSLGQEIKYYEPCPLCLKERQKEEEQEEIKRLYDKLDKSNIGIKYYPLTFKKLEIVSPSFKVAKERSEKYCQNSKECLTRGLGIYFYGNNGRGKTALIACMFKELIKQGYNPYITTMNELKDDIINKRISLEEVKAKDILCIDDIGTETYSKNDDVNWINEILFEIVSYRDKNLLSTLFTSNYKLASSDEKEASLLSNGVMKKTVERISTLATVKIEIQTDKSFRVNKETEIPF